MAAPTTEQAPRHAPGRLADDGRAVDFGEVGRPYAESTIRGLKLATGAFDPL